MKDAFQHVHQFDGALKEPYRIKELPYSSENFMESQLGILVEYQEGKEWKSHSLSFKVHELLPVEHKEFAQIPLSIDEWVSIIAYTKLTLGFKGKRRYHIAGMPENILF
jgi:hypothetical protein